MQKTKAYICSSLIAILVSSMLMGFSLVPIYGVSSSQKVYNSTSPINSASIKPPVNNSSVFALVYEKSGGFIGEFKRVSYDSFTKELVFSSRFVGGPPQIKLLSDFEENALKALVQDDGFFGAHPICPAGGSDMFNYRLFVIMDGQANGVTWMDGCQDNAIPGLGEIAQAVENATS